MLLTANQAAQQLGISHGTLTQMCRDQVIKHTRIGAKRGRYRFRQEWIDEYLSRQTVDVQGRKNETELVSAADQIKAFKADR